MHTILLLLPLVVLTALADSSPSKRKPLSVPPPWCLPTTDSGASAMMSMLQKFGTSTDSDWVVIRNTIGVPPTPVEDIVMLDDETLCQRASQAVDSQLVDGPPLGEAVYLARFGDFYAVYPPTLHGGEWSSIGFFDSTFVLKKALAW